MDADRAMLQEVRKPTCGISSPARVLLHSRSLVPVLPLQSWDARQTELKKLQSVLSSLCNDLGEAIEVRTNNNSSLFRFTHILLHYGKP